jgi:CBS domain containing-hemolysin-like protein
MSLNPTVRVKSAMTRKMITLDKGLSVKSAIKLMVKKNIGSVVVTADSSSDPVGILTERDILKSIAYKTWDYQNWRSNEYAYFVCRNRYYIRRCSTVDDKEKYSKALGERRQQICGDNNPTWFTEAYGGHDKSSYHVIIGFKSNFDAWWW